MDTSISHSGKIILASVLASGTIGLLGRMLATAYPVLQNYFGASSIQIQWVMTAPILAASSVILLGGKLGDSFGKRRIFRLGLLLLAFGILISGIGQNISFLILGQSLIGLGTALNAPACLALIKQEIKEEKLGESIGLWAGLSGAFGVLGLLLGGVIIDQFGWQYIFYISLPLVVMAFLIVPKEQFRKTESPNKSFPAHWAFAIFAAVFILVYACINGNQSAWNSIYNYLYLFVSILFLVFVFALQNRSKQPIIHAHFFKNRSVLVANLGTFFIYFSLNGIYIFLVYHLQTNYAYSPSKAGWSMIPASLMVTILASRLGKIGSKQKPSLFLKIGSLLTSLAFLGLIFSHENSQYWLHFFPFILLLGLGMSFFVSPLTNLALDVDQENTGLASGINNLVARFSGILAVVVLGGIFTADHAGFEQFRYCALIMFGSASFGTICIWLLLPSGNSKSQGV